MKQSQCRAGKIHFATEGAARRKAAAMNEKNSFRVVAYRCICGRWTVGKENKRVKRYRRKWDVNFKV